MSSPPGIFAARLAERYIIEREVGRGATAVVYLARDVVRDQSVAIKVLRPELAHSNAAHRFLREIRRHSTLRHVHILPVLDAGDTDGQLFIVLPYMAGGTLRQRLSREKQLPIADVLSIARAIAGALDHAHRQGLIHRDVKPENILFAEEQACLADFGIARAVEKVLGDSTTSTGIVRGTFAYMSPEQASGEHDYDGRTDVYSLGCVLYEMLAGVPAFIGATPEAALSQRFAHAPRELRVYRPRVSAALDAIVKRALEFAPADRFRTAGEMANALSDTRLDVESPAPLFESFRSLAHGWGTRRRWRQASIPAAVLAVVGVFVASQYSDQRSGRFRERDWILVADFDGPANDPALANAIRELTTAELNQSRFVSTLPRSQLTATMRLAGVPDTTRVGPQLARELAYRSAVRAVLVGSVNHVGRNYSIVLRAVDAADGADIWSAAGAASDSNLITTVQRLARDLREGLGERRNAIEAALPLDQIATPSFAAYRLYVEGLRLQTRGDGRGSNRVLREALALDTAFASAWFTMGWNYLNDRSLDSARWAFREAQARRNRLAEIQRYRLEADVAYAINYDIPAAIRAYDFYLAHSPRSWAVHNNRGLYLLALGRYEDALESFNRAVASHPFGPQRAQIQVMNQAATLVALGRVADAERAARDLTGPFAVYIRLMLATAQDRWGEADSVATAAASAPSSPTWLRVQATGVAAASRASRGAVRSADATLVQATVDASPDAARWFYRARLLLAVASDRAVPPLPNVLAADTSPAGLLTKGLSAALRGDTSAARLAILGVQAAPPNELRRLGSGPRLAEAWLQARTGDWAEASELITGSAVFGEHDTAILDRVGSLSLRWLAAEAYARIGRLDAATEVLELAIKPQRMPGNEFAERGLVVTFARRRLAQLYAAQGRRDDAAKNWRAFVAAMNDPDPELVALIAEARLALQRLEAA